MQGDREEIKGERMGLRKELWMQGWGDSHGEQKKMTKDGQQKTRRDTNTLNSAHRSHHHTPNTRLSVQIAT